MPDPAVTAMTARVLLLLDAVRRVSTRRLSDLDLARLVYFVDAFSPLWDLMPLDRYRLKAIEPRSLLVRQALNRLVVSGLVVPRNVHIDEGPVAQLAANYEVIHRLAAPVLDAARSTRQGRREAKLVEEVVYASAGLLDGLLDRAVRLDAGYADARLGPNDLIDLVEPTRGTSFTAKMFAGGVLSPAQAEAELTHFYMAHLERLISRA